MLRRFIYLGFATRTERHDFKRFTKRLFSSQPQNERSPSYLHSIGTEPLQYTTVGKMIETSARKWPDNIAIVSKQENQSITYSDLLKKADEIAAAFKELGLEKGDRLGLWAPNCMMWNILKIAACRIGLIVVATNSTYQSNEIKNCINKVGVKALIAPESFGKQKYYEIIRGLAPELDFCKPGNLCSENLPTLKTLLILSNNEFPGAYNYKSFLSLSRPELAQKIASEQDLIEPDDGCNIQFTSGTTGEPKAAMSSHMSIVNNAYLFGKRTHLNSKSKLCLQTPLFHAIGLVLSSQSTFQFGGTVVIPSLSYNPQANLDAVISEGCTDVHGTPTMFVDMIAEVAKNPKKIPTTIKRVVTAGAPCSPQLVKTIKNQLNSKTVTMLYGMTEIIGFSVGLEGEDMNLNYNTVGKMLEHMEAKVVDPKGKMVPFGQPGELCVRGYSVMLGYWGDEKRTKESIDSWGWFRTGDQFVLLENGYFQISGRFKDMIIRGGENIYPKEIEDYLNTHPYIMESHVFGTSHERLGEEVCAAVKVKDEAKVTVEDIKKHCMGKIAHFKIPKYIKFVTSFPKTISGKIQKNKLKEMMESGKL